MFILGFSLTFFTGAEDFSSSISYESEVAFNLAESAVEEFVARLKYSLNHDDPNNQLFKVLRDASDGKIGKEIPLEARQVANLTRFTRETAKNVYEVKFDRDMVSSKDFQVEASIKLKGIEEVKQPTYIIRKDKKEKQGELSVKARVAFKGRAAIVSLVFLVRVVKVFVPPFNYFTLYVKNGTPVGPTGSEFGGSNFNVWGSQSGEQKKNLVLDHGWRQIPGQENFDAVKDIAYWEKELALLGNEAAVPPGRVYLGQDPEKGRPDMPGIFVQSTNGTKLMRDTPTDRNINYLICGQENLFLKPDVNWMGMKTFVKDVMKMQNFDDDIKKGIIFSPWSNDNKIRIMNIGAGAEVSQDWYQDVPAFNNALGSYKLVSGNKRKTLESQMGPVLSQRYLPSVGSSGLDLFGYARPDSAIDPSGGKIDTKSLSPTLVYGPVAKMYFRVVSLGDKDADKPNQGVKLELPFVGTQKDPQTGQAAIDILPNLFGKKLNATDAWMIFSASGVSNNPRDERANYLDKLMKNWDKIIPDPIKEVNSKGIFQYEKFMSNYGVEIYNEGLANIIQRVKNKDNDKLEPYEGPLKDHLLGFLTNQEVANTSPNLQTVAKKSPVQEFFLGDLYYALPDEMSSYLMDFYFIPRSTEDFFRGRTTLSIGGVSRDRFIRKYINDADLYENGHPNQVLELNGVLALNDPAPLILNNLSFRGRGIIYCSPMMGAGEVVIKGDLMPASAKVGSTAARGSTSGDVDMLTIIAKKITIELDGTNPEPGYIEANLISVTSSILVNGGKKVTIKGSVAMPYLDLDKSFPSPDPHKEGGGTIVYNALNTIWRTHKPDLMNQMYVAKIVTGGVGKFEWKYEHD
jgi:hypothetical protein